MILTDIEIRDRVENFEKYYPKKPLIESFLENNLKAASYDVSITNKIHKIKCIEKTIDLLNQKEIDNIYKEIDIAEGYTIKPDEFILVTLNEKINISSDLIAHIRPRTSLTRLGLVIAAQHCNPTYCGVLQLGVYNKTPNPIKIYSGLCIAQIVFEKLINIPSIHKWYENEENNKPKYQNESTFIGSKISAELQAKAKIEYKNMIDELLKEQ